MRLAPAPLFRDPMLDGPTDPTVIFNPLENAWRIIYTARRANVPCHQESSVHGTDLGVASSADHGQTWLYRGTLNLEAIEPGRNTFWAPEVIRERDTFHMYVSYITGVPDAWRGKRSILHYISKNLWDWQFAGVVQLPGEHVIDACVHTIPGGWRMWYKDEEDGSHTHYADSADLTQWVHQGVAVQDQAQEGPNVFTLGGRHWMIADIWQGQAVYVSDDLTRWTRQGVILSEAGTRCEDGNRAHHADVLVQGEHAYMFYFVHPGQRPSEGKQESCDLAARRSCVQVAMLRVQDQKLIALRSEPFDFYLP